MNDSIVAEIKKILEECEEECREAGSEHQRRSAKEYAFNRIVEVMKDA